MLVRFPSTLSLAVAPASLYVSPTESVMDDWPFNVIIGGVVSVGVVVPELFPPLPVEVVVPVLPPPPVEVVVPVFPPPPVEVVVPVVEVVVPVVEVVVEDVEAITCIVPLIEAIQPFVSDTVKVYGYKPI